MDANIQFYYPKNRQRLAIFVTKEFAPLYDLLIKHQSGELACEIPCVISNHEDLSEIASQFSIPYHHFSVSTSTKAEQEELINKLMEDEKIDLLVLARYMQVLSNEFVAKYQVKIINIHHGFLPAFKGKSPYRQAWERGVKMIGATAHYVTKELDEGPIIEQETIRVNHSMTPEILTEMGKDIESMVLSKSIKLHCEKRIFINDKNIHFSHSTSVAGGLQRTSVSPLGRQTVNAVPPVVPRAAKAKHSVKISAFSHSVVTRPHHIK